MAGGCPVDDDGKLSTEASNMNTTNSISEDKGEVKKGCPIDHSSKDTSAATAAMFGIDPLRRGPSAVVMEGVNPLNNMPAANQNPAPGQKIPLSTTRVRSTIPKGTTSADESPVHQVSGEERWTYPSEQMFYNAMLRKGWFPSEEDMSNVVKIHNFVNERTWLEVLKWESMHKDTCAEPKLVRFIGRPKDYSPKARFKMLLGYTAPFDRHDWTVDRCGLHVRYVVDFYTGKGGDSNIPAMYLDVRPALDSPGALVDLVRMWFNKYIKNAVP